MAQGKPRQGLIQGAAVLGLVDSSRCTARESKSSALRGAELVAEHILIPCCWYLYQICLVEYRQKAKSNNKQIQLEFLNLC